ncbi:MAG: hypothetical protein LC128_14380 [Chitinophagales bacterium]|nr:hypothetical protein [Chitinophagales bacterium]
MAQMVKELHIKPHGWLQHFRYAVMRKRMERIDSWIKHRLRCHRLKQCKQVIGTLRWLRKCKIEETLCWRTAKQQGLVVFK